MEVDMKEKALLRAYPVERTAQAPALKWGLARLGTLQRAVFSNRWNGLSGRTKIDICSANRVIFKAAKH
jgi:hypothetical protein